MCKQHFRKINQKMYDFIKTAHEEGVYVLF